ncbi:UNVERIFIED_CONTAM: putative sarcosine oxidase [Sesamum radiatum]|uniref:Sarcosine oxidase n=1 Tax=Sesamum radiatum TaxID=300843 RepID=A0AAW2L8Z1_SESRA
MVTPQGGVVKATKAVAMFQTLGVQNDAMLKDNKEVIDIKKNQSTGEIVVFTRADEKFRAKKCWKSPPITGRLTKAITINKDFPTFGSHGDPPIYDTPSLEFSGLIKIHIDDGGACEPEERTWAAPPDILDLLRECIRERFGGLVDSNGPVITQSCMYSMTPDKDYVINFLRGEFGKEAVVIGGFSGHGFKMALVVGQELVASGTKEGVDQAHFRIPRFKKNLRGNRES